MSRCVYNLAVGTPGRPSTHPLAVTHLLIHMPQIPPVPEGLVRSSFLAVGTFDQTVRILSMDPGQGLKNLAVQVRHVY